MKPSAPLVFRTEDAEARRTGKVITRELTNGKDRYAWAFFPFGLQLMAPLKAQPIIDVSITIRNGAQDDTIPGIAHALEHMVCKDVFSEGVHPAYEPIIPYGLIYNASTSYERTNYFAFTQNGVWREALDALIKIVFHSETIDEARWEKERPAILQEIRSAGEDRRVWNALNALHHPQNPRKQTPILGHEADVKRITAADLKETYDRAYHPQNALIVVQGLESIEEVVSFLDQHEGLKRAAGRTNERLRRPADTELDLGVSPTITLEGGKSIEQLIMTSAPFGGNGSTPDLWRAAWILVEIMNMPGGLITQEMRRKHGFTYSASMEMDRLATGERYLDFTGKMHAKNMDEAAVVWKALWKDACLNLPKGEGSYAALLRTFNGYFDLKVAREALMAYHDQKVPLGIRWMEQNPRPMQPHMLTLTSAELAPFIALLPQLADLEWQTAKVLQMQSEKPLT